MPDKEFWLILSTTATLPNGVGTGSAGVQRSCNKHCVWIPPKKNLFNNNNIGIHSATAAAAYCAFRLELKVRQQRVLTTKDMCAPWQLLQLHMNSGKKAQYLVSSWSCCLLLCQQVSQRWLLQKTNNHVRI